MNNFHSNPIHDLVNHQQSLPSDDLPDPFSNKSSKPFSSVPHPPKETINGKQNDALDTSATRPKRPIFLVKPHFTSAPQKSPLIFQDRSSPEPTLPNKPPQNSSTMIKDLSIGRKPRNTSSESRVRDSGGPMSLIKAYLESGYSTAMNKEYDKALAVTLQAKGMIEKYLAKEWKFEFEFPFLTFHNLIAINYR